MAQRARRAVRDVERPAVPRWAVVALAVLIVAVLGTGAVVMIQSSSARTVAVEQGSTVARVCANDPGAANRAGADCEQAAAIVQGGVEAVDGTNGVGVTGTTLDDGRLVVSYSDGRTQDVGRVVGEDGQAGPEGRGITGTSVVNGRLLVAFTDGTRVDLGEVVGPAGRGIVSLDGSSGRLLVTLTDGDVLDAGPLPAGPKGTDGASAPVVQSVTRYYSDGSIERCRRDGGTDVDPVQQCTRTPPPEPAPEDPPGSTVPTLGG